jgi:outer membrane protein TolC
MECRGIARRLNTQARYVEAAKKSFEMQQKKLKLEERKFNQGRSSIQWILTYQDDLSNAEIQYYEALMGYYKAQADLKLITGVSK